ncbi:MAG: AAA family ATPase [Rhodopirellula sp.]|nr:AAA family ATPase [Rhodopirellula sp.]
MSKKRTSRTSLRKKTPALKSRITFSGHEISTLMVIGADDHGKYEEYEATVWQEGIPFVKSCIEEAVTNRLSSVNVGETRSERIDTRASTRLALLRRDESRGGLICISKLARLTYPLEHILSTPALHHFSAPKKRTQVFREIDFVYIEATLPTERHLLAADPQKTLILQLSADAILDVSQRMALKKALKQRMGNRKGQNSVVVLSAATLERLGIPCAVSGSWEQFANGLRRTLSEKTSDESIIRYLCKSTSLVIRHRSTSAIVISSVDNKQQMSLVHASSRLPNSTAPSEHMHGYTSVMAASIAIAVSESSDEAIYKAALSGTEEGLRRCSVLSSKGYGKEDGTVDYEWHRRLFRSDEFIAQAETVRVPDSDNWSAVTQTISDVSSGILSRSRAIQVGLSIVKRGLEKVEMDLSLPVGRFGQVSVIDRKEFEGFLQVQLAMKGYVEGPVTQQPLSLAVFGPPGSGKSFGVVQVAASLRSRVVSGDVIEANVSQFSSYGDLANTLHAARDIALGGKIPLVLFDEFDATFERRPFGWLRYFLAPMQDGKFRHGESVYNTGRAIYMFVGGVNHTFDMLDGRLRNHEFIEAKGPDFVSRLKGHMNVLGIGRHNDDATYILRRAVLLRSILGRFQGRIIDSDGVAAMDEDVIRALLVVDHLKHGVRSMEAIVRMCRVRSEQRQLHWGALPSSEQLHMHVDALALDAARLG